MESLDNRFTSQVDFKYIYIYIYIEREREREREREAVYTLKNVAVNQAHLPGLSLSPRLSLD